MLLKHLKQLVYFVLNIAKYIEVQLKVLIIFQ